jgi:hypothetical protein
VLARQPAVVRAGASRVVDLGGEDVVLAALEEAAEQAPGDLLARPVVVHVGGVEVVTPASTARRTIGSAASSSRCHAREERSP